MCRLDARTLFLSELDEKIRPLNDDEEILWVAVQAVGEHLGAARCFFCEVDLEREMIAIHRDFRAGAAAPTIAGQHRLGMIGDTASLAPLQAGRVCAITDTAADARTASCFDAVSGPPGLRSVLAVPCMSGGEWIATLVVSRPEPHVWSMEEIALLETVVSHVWLPVENVRLIARLRQELRERERAEAAMRASEERYRSLVQATTSVVWTADAAGRFITPQHSWAAYTGQKWREHRDLGWLKMLHPEDRAATLESWTKTVARPAPYESEGRVWNAAAREYHHAVARAVPVFRPDGSVKEWIGAVTDVHDRKKAERALHASEERFHRLIEANVIGVISGDRDCIREANEVFLQTFGYTREEMRAGLLSWRDITPPEWAEQDRQKVDELFARGAVQPFEKEYLTCTGRRVPILVGVALLTRDPMTWIAFVLDQSLAKQTQRDLRAAKEAAEAANAAKDRFLAMLSHELRTPLMPAMLSLSAMAEDAALPRETREEIAVIRHSVELEARLIDDLLDLTRVARGKLLLAESTLDLFELLREAGAILQKDAAAKGIAIFFKLDESAGGPPCVRGDRARLEQVFCNLIKNAIKFTPSGGRLHISARTLSPGRDGAEIVEVKFRDNGMGIEPALLSRIFDPFEQGTPELTTRHGGLGLGLAISKMLIEMHRGAISAASDGPGHGSEFTVTLPVLAHVRAPWRAVDAVAPGSRPISSRVLKILLVEDHEPTVFVMTRLLRRRGHEVHAAHSVRQALDHPALAGVDLVISDLGLPDGSGLDLMRELQVRYGLRGIALSGFGMEGDVKKSLEAGFTLHLAKPIDVRQLEAALDQVAAGMASRGEIEARSWSWS